MALPMKGRTRDGPGMKRFLLRYEICSRRRRKRIKHIRYGISWVRDKDVDNDNMDFMRVLLILWLRRKKRYGFAMQEEVEVEFKNERKGNDVCVVNV